MSEAQQDNSNGHLDDLQDEANRINASVDTIVPLIDKSIPKRNTYVANRIIENTVNPLKKKHEEEQKVLQELVIRDRLTKLYNRTYFEEEVDKAIMVKGRGVGEFGIIIIDADHFKQINDKYGHLKGDEVLKNLANCIQSTVRSTDTVVRLGEEEISEENTDNKESNNISARWGGEEFAVLVRLSPKEKKLSKELLQNHLAFVAEKIRSVVDEANIFVIDNKKQPLTISAGAYYYDEIPEERSNDELYIEKKRNKILGFADDALYLAKHEGRNRAMLYIGHSEQGEPFGKKIEHGYKLIA